MKFGYRNGSYVALRTPAEHLAAAEGYKTLAREELKRARRTKDGMVAWDIEKGARGLFALAELERQNAALEAALSTTA